MLKPHPLPFGNYIRVDNTDIEVRVCGFAYYADGSVKVLCAWWNNGEHKEEWFDSWRLSE